MRISDRLFSEDEIITLERLWLAVPEIPTREIGRRMNRSHNSVIGKADRMGLPKRENYMGKKSATPKVNEVHIERLEYSVKDPLPAGCWLALKILREAPNLDV